MSDKLVKRAPDGYIFVKIFFKISSFNIFSIVDVTTLLSVSTDFASEDMFISTSLPHCN